MSFRRISIQHLIPVAQNLHLNERVGIIHDDQVDFASKRFLKLGLLANQPIETGRVQATLLRQAHPDRDIHITLCVKRASRCRAKHPSRKYFGLEGASNLRKNIALVHIPKDNPTRTTRSRDPSTARELHQRLLHVQFPLGRFHPFFLELMQQRLG